MKKEDLVEAIARHLGVQPPRMSTGSTEPREIFDLVNITLALGIEDHLTKPETARQIVEASGESWNPDYESSGGTVTKPGLQAVLKAVEHFVS